MYHHPIFPQVFDLAHGFKDTAGRNRHPHTVIGEEDPGPHTCDVETRQQVHQQIMPIKRCGAKIPPSPLTCMVAEMKRQFRRRPHQKRRLSI